MLPEVKRRSHPPKAHHVREAAHSPPGRDGDAHEGFVPQQLPVKLLEVLELPFHLPGELAMGQLDGVNVGAWYLRSRTPPQGLSSPTSTHKSQPTNSIFVQFYRN